MHDLVHMGGNPRGNTPTTPIASPKQKKLSCGMNMCDEPPYPLDTVGRHEPLLGKDILELSVVLIGEFEILRFLDIDSFPLSALRTQLLQALVMLEKSSSSARGRSISNP
jgi:hypothetical protein